MLDFSSNNENGTIRVAGKRPTICTTCTILVLNVIGGGYGDCDAIVDPGGVFLFISPTSTSFKHPTIYIRLGNPRIFKFNIHFQHLFLTSIYTFN